MATDETPERLTASQRLAKALGRPLPPPPTAEQLREWEAVQDLADEEVARFYGLDNPAAA